MHQLLCLIVVIRLIDASRLRQYVPQSITGESGAPCPSFSYPFQSSLFKPLLKL
jgi:hypothetical protein